MLLKDLYNLKLMEYELQGLRERPDKLLAMLLLSERDKYEPLSVPEGIFYKKYQEEIDKKIVQVENDFKFTQEDIIKYVEETVVCDNYEHDRIWFVFCEGFGAMHWGLMYRKEKTPEEIYSEYFGETVLMENEEKPYVFCKKKN